MYVYTQKCMHISIHIHAYICICVYWLYRAYTQGTEKKMETII